MIMNYWDFKSSVWLFLLIGWMGLAHSDVRVPSPETSRPAIADGAANNQAVPALFSVNASMQSWCEEDVISQGPNGNVFLTASIEPSLFALAGSSSYLSIWDTECLAAGGSDHCRKAIAALAGIRILRWINDRAFLAIAGNQHIYRVKFEHGIVDFTEVGNVRPYIGQLLLSFPPVQSQDDIDRETSSIIAGVNSQNRKWALRSVSYDNGYYIYGYDDLETTNLVVQSPIKLVNTQIPIAYIQRHKDPNLIITKVATGGYEPSLLRDDIQGPKSFRTSTLVGSNHQVARKRITNTINGSESIISGQYGGRRFSVSCGITTAANVIALDAGGADRPLHVTIFEPLEHAAGTILIFGGGPAGQFTFKDNNFLKIFIKMHRRVVIVDYSGSVGHDLKLLNRMPLEGVRSIGNDIDAISNLLKRKPKWSPISAVGISFGAVFAAKLASAEKMDIRHVVFVTPLLKLQDPKLWRLTDSEISYQHAFESRFLAIRNDEDRHKWNRSFESWYSRIHTKNILVVFGNNDQRSKSLDWHFSSDARILLLPGSHNSPLVNPSFWSNLEAFLM